ncbi:MAG: helix-turn-helix domain-containing protein [Actinomycetota bacterium]|nr:helix-turn-helix domain-containing protein [Actinomycetota bacterium]
MTRRAGDGKEQELARSRTLNPRPEVVADGAFVSSEFFDARDLVQVKYEMVRRVEAEGLAVSAAAGAFGFSRQSYYTAAAALAEGGLAGLVPAKPGPRGAHKLTGEVLEHLAGLRAADPGLRAADLAGAAATRFGVRVHPRSVERALARWEAAKRGSKSG